MSVSEEFVSLSAPSELPVVQRRSIEEPDAFAEVLEQQSELIDQECEKFVEKQPTDHEEILRVLQSPLAPLPDTKAQASNKSLPLKSALKKPGLVATLRDKVREIRFRDDGYISM